MDKYSWEWGPYPDWDYQYNQPSPREDYFDSFATSHTRVTGTDVQVSLSSNNTT